MYLVFMTFSLCLTYFVLFYFSPLFFNTSAVKISAKSLRSIAVIVLLSTLGYLIAFNIPDLELSNRFLHAFGGGFMAFLVCFLAIKDSKLPINKFQFFVFSILIVVTLGVANEVLEFFLQNYFDVKASSNINDTWLDLISNIVGAALAGICFTQLINTKTVAVPVNK